MKDIKAINNLIDHLDTLYELKGEEPLTLQRVVYQEAILDLKWRILKARAKLLQNETTN